MRLLFPTMGLLMTLFVTACSTADIARIAPIAVAASTYAGLTCGDLDDNLDAVLSTLDAVELQYADEGDLAVAVDPGLSLGDNAALLRGQRDTLSALIAANC